MRFDLSDLRLFVNVVEQASMSLGAAATHLAPASASERIKNMELELGVALLVRDPKGVHPTPVGVALLRHARTMLELNEEMRSELMDYAQGLRGRLRLLSNTAALSEVLPALIAGFLVDNPNIDIDVEERESQAIVEAILSGERDAGIIAGFAATSQLELIPLASDHLVLVTPLDHLFATLETVEFARAASHELIGLLADNALTRHLERQAAQLSRRLRWRAQLPTFQAICELAARGVGAGIVSRTAAERAATVLQLAVIPLSDAWARRQIYLCVRKDRDTPRHLDKFVDHVRSFNEPKAALDFGSY